MDFSLFCFVSVLFERAFMKCFGELKSFNCGFFFFFELEFENNGILKYWFNWIKDGGFQGENRS
jgi:hypothetical protein